MIFYRQAIMSVLSALGPQVRLGDAQSGNEAWINQAWIN